MKSFLSLTGFQGDQGVLGSNIRLALRYLRPQVFDSTDGNKVRKIQESRIL
ncbi:MAG: hypothetical protein ONB44_17150 [candidate division KSB1 bacterium]|nr:hypothetical protein [candidate division KSB1 bacterium]MDZ7303863.1 hypothetical protein [candidate division KSB1 bacterium]MDZ7313213.1 hypothetical protein [candidate division KSB1 bacterium]